MVCEKGKKKYMICISIYRITEILFYGLGIANTWAAYNVSNELIGLLLMINSLITFFIGITFDIIEGDRNV